MMGQLSKLAKVVFFLGIAAFFLKVNIPSLPVVIAIAGIVLALEALGF